METETKRAEHTPGPWSRGRIDARGCQLIVAGTAAAPRGLIARMHPGELPVAEQHANARLIASAPELLAGLRGALDCDECQCAEMGLDARTCWHALARAAIAKVEAQS